MATGVNRVCGQRGRKITRRDLDRPVADGEQTVAGLDRLAYIGFACLANNLELLQQLQDSGALKWIGTCSELNASYAADGYSAAPAAPQKLHR